MPPTKSCHSRSHLVNLFSLDLQTNLGFAPFHAGCHGPDGKGDGLILIVQEETAPKIPTTLFNEVPPLKEDGLS